MKSTASMGQMETASCIPNKCWIQAGPLIFHDFAVKSFKLVKHVKQVGGILRSRQCPSKTARFSPSCPYHVSIQLVRQSHHQQHLLSAPRTPLYSPPWHCHELLQVWFSLVQFWFSLQDFVRFCKEIKLDMLKRLTHCESFRILRENSRNWRANESVSYLVYGKSWNVWRKGVVIKRWINCHE